MAGERDALPPPLIQPLGDRGLIVRFGTSLSDEANRAAIAFARRLEMGAPAGVLEVHPNLVSVLLKYDPSAVGYERLAGEVRLLFGVDERAAGARRRHAVPVVFDGADLADVARSLGLSVPAFVREHCARPLRILATGFAPGFVYCGFHPEGFDLSRRTNVRAKVPAGTVIFAARQTAIASTPIPTGWHVIGHTSYSNFDAAASPPTRLGAGDEIVFEALA